MGKNILEVCLSPDLGGLELFTVQCYQAFKQKETCKVVLTKDKKLDKYLECDDKLYIKRNKLFPFLPAIRLATIIDENKIDIIHFHWTRDIITVVLAKIISKSKPKIIQSRHMRMTRFKDDIYHRWIYKNIFMIHAVTQDVKAQLLKFIPPEIVPKVELNYLGVQTKEIHDIKPLKEKYHIEENDFIVGIVGRVQEGKGQHIVIEALAKLKELNIKLFIVGDDMGDEYLEYLHEECIKLDVSEKVFFTGFTKEVDAYMQLCDVTVLATKNETFGLVIIESMINQTPVIATDRGGPLEIIDDNDDGLLYDGSSEDLAKKIKILYENETLRDTLKKNSLKKVQDKFDFNTQLDKLYEMITKD